MLANRQIVQFFVVFTAQDMIDTDARARARVCVCLYSSTVKASSVCRMSDTYLMGTDQKCYVVLYDVLCQVPSSQYLKMSYFTLKDELQHADKLERNV